MSRYNTKRSITKVEILKRVFIVLCALALVIGVLPRNTKLTYNEEVGQIWRRQNLYAPFDFDVLKPDSVLLREQALVRQNFSPYFNYADTIVQTIVDEVQRLSSDYQLPIAERILLCLSINHHYAQGVVDSVDYARFVVSNGASSVTVVKNDTENVVDGDDLTNLQTTYNRIIGECDSLQQAFIESCQLRDLLIPNLVYDTLRNERELQARLSDIAPTYGVLQEASIIVTQGQEITPDISVRIHSLNVAIENRDDVVDESQLKLLGQTLFALIILSCYCIFLMLFRSDYIHSFRHIMLLAVLVVAMPVLTSLVLRFQLFTVYAIPFAIIPIMARVFTDSRTAAMTMAASILLSMIALDSPYNFLVVQFVAGIVSIYALRDLSERSQLFRCAVYVTVMALLTLFSLDLLRDGQIAETGWMNYLGIAFCCLLLLFTYPLLFIFERLFGFTSNVTLVELSNVNNKLLRRLSEEAPGTFQHCLQVANLAAEVANYIGAKSQLVRTGALYHDIGKLKHSAFFTENQRGINPHDRLTPSQSARVIIDHVANGLELATKHNLPQVIRDFIATHHGCGKAMYFYIKEREAHPDETIDIAPFTYPGPNPTTLEQAILMMADAVEAASRSLKEYTDESIAQLVDKIVDGQVTAGYFVLCPITFRDIAKAKKVLCDKLRSIYHTRISYPTLK